MEEHLKQRIEQLTTELAPQLLAINRSLFEKPELGLQERFACELLGDFLRSRGFALRTGLGGLTTSFQADCPASWEGPAFALLAEYDALPEIGHGCGHNLIAASAVGAGAVLLRLREEGSLNQGRLLVIGTPAEETLGGKIPMLAEGVFEGIDATVMVHPETLNIARGKALAVDHLRFRFLGKSAHAASNPQAGINALEAVLLTFQAVNALRQHLPPTARVHGIVTRGGTAANVIPDLGEVEFMVRMPHREELNLLRERVVDCARGAALATGCRLEIEAAGLPCDEIRDNPALSALLEESMRDQGLSDILPEDPYPGSSDFGNVSQAIPAAYAFVAFAPPGVEIHSREFAAATVTPVGEKALLTMVRVLAEVGARFWSEPILREQVYLDFHQRREDAE
ncbi:MAG: M20 family metallopeptidase [Coprothermobacterota bacterium]|nr:M20 family metallopeptidase [Coprothermobacterota bacterium]